jgi:hypothetical protein
MGVVVQMKKILALALAATVMAAFAPPATAQKRPKPVKTSLYLHGDAPLGDVDGVFWLAEDYENEMTPEEPDGSAPRSWRLGTPGLNTKCTGLPLAFPTWRGRVSGTITGKPKLQAHFATPAVRVTARIWVDVPVFSCNEGYIPPASEVIVDIPAGHNEIEIEFDQIRARAQGWVMIQLLASGAGQAGRILYDSADMASMLEFQCIPARGKSCTP